MGLFGKLFKKNKNLYKITEAQENNLVVMLNLRKRVKLPSKILVPENFCAVIFSKEHLLDIIPFGEHELNGFNVPKVCKINKMNKPTKKGYKKDFKADFYYVNFSPFKIVNEFYIKKLNLNINYFLMLKITDAIKFLKFILSERVVFKDEFSNNYLQQRLSEVVYYFYLDNKITSYEKLKEHLTKKLKTIGIEILEFNLKDCFNANVTKIEEKPVYADVGEVIEPIKTIESNEKVVELNNSKPEITYKNSSVVDLNEINTEKVLYFKCDNCGVFLPKDSKVCYNCKKSFIEQNLCGVCGKVMPKDSYVCPNCGGVNIEN